jgi:cell division protein ZipA
MMSQLRWTLLILGVLFIAVLAWWERRRPRQASGALERRAVRESLPDAPTRAVRDPPLTLPEVHSRSSLATDELPVVEIAPVEIAPVEVAPEAHAVPLPEPEARPQVAPHAYEALDADETDEADERDEDDTVDDLPQIDETVAAAMAAQADVALEPAKAADTTEAPPVGRPRELLPELPAAAPMVVEWPTEGERRIVALRLVAPQTERFPGRSLRQALAAEGFHLGQFAIFHKPDDERRAVLSAASLTRPGTFDMETMDSQHYGGLSLFAVLPGPKPPPQAFDELVFTARNLNERLQGVLQDEQGAPLTPARIAQLREQLRTGTGS